MERSYPPFSHSSSSFSYLVGDVILERWEEEAKVKSVPSGGAFTNKTMSPVSFVLVEEVVEKEDLFRFL